MAAKPYSQADGSRESLTEPHTRWLNFACANASTPYFCGRMYMNTRSHVASALMEYVSMMQHKMGSWGLVCSILGERVAHDR